MAAPRAVLRDRQQGDGLGRSTVTGVAEYLRGMIHRGEVGPGDRLPPERQLSADLGVDRATLREAIKQLVADGYLLARRGAGGGTFVTELLEPQQRWLAHMRKNMDELEDLLEFRVALERPEMVQEHQAILDAIEARDGDTGTELMEDHLSHIRDNLREMVLSSGLLVAET